MKYSIVTTLIALLFIGCGTETSSEAHKVQVTVDNVEAASTSVNGFYRNDFQPTPFTDNIGVTSDDFIFITILRAENATPNIEVTLNGKVKSGTIVYSKPGIEDAEGLIAERFRYNF